MRGVLTAFALIVLPVVLAISLLHVWHWDFSIPLAYGFPGADEIWQLICSKTLLDTGWVLENPYLGAPAVSEWYNNSGAQTSALHSVLMLGISVFIEDAVRVQQIYYFANFALITCTAYWVIRLFGASAVPSFVAALIFSFTSYRIHALFFAFLSNYFVVPLSLVPVVWIISGRLSLPERSSTPEGGFFTRNKFFLSSFVASVLIVLITAVSDGYYAFFALLLLGFAVAYRLMIGDVRRPLRVLPGVLCVVLLIGSALALASPLTEFRRAHPEQANQDQMKNPGDAEVYSPSLKLLVTPIPDHRVGEFRKLAREMLASANFNRRFPYTEGTPVPLGTLGTILFAGAMVLLFSGTRNWWFIRDESFRHRLWIFVALSFFITLCSLGGGLGSLVALVYPSIRAYERFPIFLIFVLLAGAAVLVTHFTAGLSAAKTWVVRVALLVLCGLTILDQVPRDVLSLSTAQGFADRSKRFLSERAFVHRVEATLQPDAMIYQYPYSQYLSDSKYYGWGSFGHLRLYLHSKTIRWSNGGAKGSPGDNWHQALALLKVEQIIDEARAVGFAGIVVDKGLISLPEYGELRRALVEKLGAEPVEDEGAQLAFWSLSPSPFRIEYNDTFERAERLTVSSLPPGAEELLPRIIDRAAFMREYSSRSSTFPLVITRQQHPEIFRDGSTFIRGTGRELISPINDMTGDILCNVGEDQAVASVSDMASLTIANRSTFDWYFNVGDRPLRIGFHLYNESGVQLAEGSIPGQVAVERGGTTTVRFSVPDILKGRTLDQNGAVVQFAFLQDGHAWFSQRGNRECRLQLRP
jgi:hypothetical protein